MLLECFSLQKIYKRKRLDSTTAADTLAVNNDLKSQGRTFIAMLLSEII